MEIDAFDLFKVTLWRKSFTLHVKFLHWHNFGIFVLHLLDRSPITFRSFLNKIQTISEFRFAPSTVKDIRSEIRQCHSHFSLAGLISFLKLSLTRFEFTFTIKYFEFEFKFIRFELTWFLIVSLPIIYFVNSLFFAEPMNNSFSTACLTGSFYK